MKNQIPRSIRPGFALSLMVASGLLLAAALILPRTAKTNATQADVTTPEISAAQDGLGAPEAPTDAVSTARDVSNRRAPEQPGTGPGEVARPEMALLHELPKVQVTRAPNSPLSDLKVSFKLDSRLTQSVYLGDRWLAPPTYLQVGKGQDCTVEASIRGLNGQGKAVNTPATWHVDNPEMVELSPPGPGNTIKLKVVRPGQTTVEVSSQGLTKRLPLHATSYGGTIMVAMAQ